MSLAARIKTETPATETPAIVAPAALVEPEAPQPQPTPFVLSYGALPFSGPTPAGPTPAESEVSVRWLDPMRCVLPEDGGWWELLLWRCAREYGEQSDLYGLLHGLRCGGCSIKRRDNGSLRLDYANLLDTWDEAELRNDWLMPQRDAITSLLRDLFDIPDAEKKGAA